MPRHRSVPSHRTLVPREIATLPAQNVALRFRLWLGQKLCLPAHWFSLWFEGHCVKRCNIKGTVGSTHSLFTRHIHR